MHQGAPEALPQRCWRASLAGSVGKVVSRGEAEMKPVSDDIAALDHTQTRVGK
jgi:hypothetical protein